MNTYEKLHTYTAVHDAGDRNSLERREIDAFIDESYQPGQSSKKLYWTKRCGVHVLMFIVNIVLFLLMWQGNEMTSRRLINSPAQDAVNYISQKWDHTNIYLRNGSVNPRRTFKGFGPPSDESDEAWAELLQYQNIRLNKNELGEFKDFPDLVAFNDGSGYYASISAYHSLHCIKRLHHHMYLNHYYPNKTEEERSLITHHTEHCLNILLQTVKCNADLTVLPMEWGASTRVPIGLDEGHHQCVNWEGIDGWMKERSVDVFEKGMVVHPLLGEAYPGGKGDEIGIVVDHLLGGGRNGS